MSKVNEVISGTLEVTEQDGVYTATLETAGAKELTATGICVDGAMYMLGSIIEDYLAELRGDE